MIVCNRSKWRDWVVMLHDFETVQSLEKPLATRTDELCVKVTPGMKTNWIIMNTIVSKPNTYNISCNVNGTIINCICYADDSVLLAPTARGL